MTTGPRRKPPITKWFTHWRELKDQGEVVVSRQTDYRNQLVEAVQEFGEEDDKGNLFYDLPKPVEFTDHEGRVFVYRTLKAERHLTPAQPTPDLAKSEALLKEKDLWLSEKQAKSIKDIQTASRYVTITVSVDPDAVAKAYFEGIISEAEYDAILREQKESYQFRPSE